MDCNTRSLEQEQPLELDLVVENWKGRRAGRKRS